MIKLLLTVAFIVASLVGGLYVVYPHYETYATKMAENDVLYEELENVMIYVNQLKIIKERIVETEEDLNKIERALPEDHDAPSLFLYLKNKMEENNLQITGTFGDFSTQEYTHNETEHSRIKQVSFSISFTGNYSDTKNFFREIEKLMRLITVDNVSLSRGGDIDPMLGFAGIEEIGAGDSVSVTINAKTYSY
jgi:type IV pilus assembly protein PilO